MISAGNDIVALNAVDIQRTELPAFYLKFITKAEFALHERSALSFTTFVWLMWSVKESVYKYLKRFDTGLVFSPIKIIVEQLTQSERFNEDHFKCDATIRQCYAGVVKGNNNVLYFKSVLTDEFVATAIAGGELYWGVKNILGADYKTQSDQVRLFALDTLGGIIVSDELWFDKHADGGYPILMHAGSLVDIPISFAHHDSYVSYAFQIPK